MPVPGTKLGTREPPTALERREYMCYYLPMPHTLSLIIPILWITRIPAQTPADTGGHVTILEGDSKAKSL